MRENTVTNRFPRTRMKKCGNVIMSLQYKLSKHYNPENSIQSFKKSVRQHLQILRISSIDNPTDFIILLTFIMIHII